MRKLLYAIAGCVLLLFVFLAFSRQTALPALAASTPDPQSVLDRAQDAVTFANGVNATMGIMLAFIACVTALLSFLGLSTYRDFRKQAVELTTSVKSIKDELLRSRDAFMHINLGDRFEQQSDRRAALENYRRAAALLPDDVEVTYILGLAFNNIDAYDDAIRVLERANASARRKDDKSESGERALARARLLKELGLAYRRRAEKLSRDADYDKAEQCLNESITLDSDESNTYASLGGLYRQRGKYKLAYDCYQKALQINQNSTYALGNLGSLAWHAGDIEAAKRYFAAAETLARLYLQRTTPDPFWYYYDLALALLALGRIGEATKMYDRAIAMTPGIPQFDTVLNNLELLQRAPKRMAGLDKIVAQVRKGRDAVSG